MSNADYEEITQELYAAAARKRAADAAAKAAKPPTLTLAASGDPGAEQVASVPLNAKDVETVREALAKRRMRIGGDIVGFDKVTEARVTMRWTRCTPAPEFGRVRSEYDPFARGGDRE